MVWQKCKVLEVRYNKPYIDSHLKNFRKFPLGLYALCTILNETTLVSEIPCWSNFIWNWFLRFQHLWCTLAALIPAVAEPPELSWLKCTGHHHKGNTSSNALQTEQFLVCRIEQAYLARRWVQRYYNHMFYNTSSVVITTSSRHYYKIKLSKTVVQTITLNSELEKQRKENTTTTTRRKSIPG